MKIQAKPSFSGNLKAFRGSTLRRLRSTPSYFFLVWRWSMWLYALIIIVGVDSSYKAKPVYPTTVALLLVTFLQTAFVTLYAPVFQRLFSLKKRQPAPPDDDTTDIFPPIARTPNPYRNIATYGLDLVLCGLIIYYSGPFSIAPDFGVSSPFYRYGMSTIFAFALTYQYRGGLAAALFFDLFILLGIFLPAPGAPNPPYHPNVIDITTSLIDAPVIAVLTGYLASLLNNLTNNKHELQQNARVIQDSARRESYLRSIMESIVRLAQEQQEMLQKCLEQTRQGGHFYAVLLLIPAPTDEHEGAAHPTPTYLEAAVTGYTVPAKSKQILHDLQSLGQKYQNTVSTLEDTARLYLPFFKNGRVSLILGAESKQLLNGKDEIFLTTVGAQLLVALENIDLAEQTVQLAAAAERGRLAREIHDGVAQLVYMLSLNAETCAAQAQRIAEASEEDSELIAPLAQRLDKLVKITKQALWETRTYMFTLKPLISGNTTLTQMLSNQLQEFETISGLSTKLEVIDEDLQNESDTLPSTRQAQIGTAIFRIVQEALTNAYKHAEASQILVRLYKTAEYYTIEVSDDGHGLPQLPLPTHEKQELARLYSGYGLRGMRERTEELEGTFEICPSQAGGVKVYARLPL